MNKELNIDLFKKIRAAIAKEPNTYTQTSYGYTPSENNFGPPQPVQISCKTPGCVAGHALVITGIPVTEDSLIAVAQQQLGLTDEQRLLLFEQFWPDHWFDDEDAPLHTYYGEETYIPNDVEALKVLDRLIKHGFDQ